MIDRSKQVIIIGCVHPNTLGLIRSFGEAGFKPNLITDVTDSDNICSRSKYVGKVVYVENYDSLDSVIRKEFPGGGVIVTISDKAAEYLDRVYDKLADSYIMPSFHKEGGHFKKNISKETQRIKASENGILTPQSWLVNWQGDSKKVPQGVIYPCIIKAVDSEIGPKDINIFNNESELIWGLDELASKCEKPQIQIQEFLKKDKEILFLGYANGKDDICIPCVLEKGLEYPEGFGWHLFGILTPDVNKYININKIKRLIASYDYSGLFGLDFLWANGKSYMCEINFRNDLNSYYSSAAGVNLPFLWYKAVTNQGTDNSEARTKKNYSIIREMHAFVWAREQKHWWRMIREFFKSDFKEIWNSKDPAPFWCVVKHHIKK